MAATSTAGALTSALEDYLETIYELVRDHKLARVKEIARARGVRSGSVTPAMKRLAELGLIRYVQREYIDLTPEGERAARRVYARHQIMTRFFAEVLGLPATAAEADACAMEHSLSPEGMDHLVRLFEFLKICPEGQLLLDKFRHCSLVHNNVECPDRATCPALGQRSQGQSNNLSQLQPGDRAQVTQVSVSGPVRQRLLDMGILPDVVVELERRAPSGDPIWIKLQGYQLSLRRKEAQAVRVVPV